MSKLTIESPRQMIIGTQVKKITGFTDEEISELNSMDYREMKETVLNILDERNGNIGTCWACGNGVYQMWINDGAVFVEIGSSCD